ncbi:nucleoside diphosphate kinase 6 isoform X1 [Cryptotermes secundus]|uniref:nucleoside diphosphate kinase 6 isoform X1 n=1 Tax=Cryptotermes secundus TaxID=105785 RepID=UPI000CD7C02A|nr:nucleoside diphosphate kinase 6 isoform X1 [Cryptotermes secundus]
MQGNLQLTLAIIKPHVTKAPHALQKIRETILSSGFYVVQRKSTIMTEEVAAEFYAEHRNKFFYNRLVTLMRSGPSEVHILARQNAIKVWRSLMGPTKVYHAQFTAPESIRGRFGLTDTRNATHGSDSPESATREIEIFFPDFSIDRWFLKEAEYFNTGAVKLRAQEFVHRIISAS